MINLKIFGWFVLLIFLVVAPKNLTRFLAYRRYILCTYFKYIFTFCILDVAVSGAKNNILLLNFMTVFPLNVMFIIVTRFIIEHCELNAVRNILRVIANVKNAVSLILYI